MRWEEVVTIITSTTCSVIVEFAEEVDQSLLVLDEYVLDGLALSGVCHEDLEQAPSTEQ